MGLLFPGNPGALAGAWTLEQGRSELTASLTAGSTDREFDSGGNTRDRDCFSKAELSPYFQYGLRPGLTAIGEAAVAVEQNGSGSDSTREVKLSRLEAGVRFRLLDSEQGVVSVQPTVALHTGRRGVDNTGSRSGDIDYELNLLAGRSHRLAGHPVFQDTRLGYRYRDSGRVDAAKLDWTIGVDITPRWTLLAQSFNEWPVSSGQGSGSRPRKHEARLSAVRRLGPDLRLQVGLGHVVAGQDTLRETNAIVALWWSF